jgi:hypothetical protein
MWELVSGLTDRRAQRVDVELHGLELERAAVVLEEDMDLEAAFGAQTGLGGGACLEDERGTVHGAGGTHCRESRTEDATGPRFPAAATGTPGDW